MFNTLATAEIIPEVSLEELDSAIETLLFEEVSLSVEMSTLLKEISSLSETAHNLMALHEAVEKFGITQALLQMTNSDGILTRHIPEIPSLESLTADLSVEDSAAALEGISSKLAEIMAFVREKFAKFLKLFSQSYRARQRVIHAVIDRAILVAKRADGKTFSEEQAEKVKGKFIPYAEVERAIALAMNVHNVFRPLFDWELPATREEKSVFDAKLLAFVKEHREDYRIVGHESAHRPAKHNGSVSLHEAGYTAESLDKIISELKAYKAHFDKEEKNMESDVNIYIEKINSILDNRSFLEKLGDVGKLLVSPIPIVGPIVNYAFTTALDRIISSATAVFNMTWEATWDSYRNGPAKAVQIVSSVTRAYK